MVGGIDPCVTVKSMIKKLFSLEARASLNWEGRKQRNKPVKIGLEHKMATKILKGIHIFHYGLALMFIFCFRGSAEAFQYN